jgi:O-Antigen ligase
VSAGAVLGRPISLPLINASPVVDLAFVAALVPVWWVLGVEQFIWLAATGWIALRILVRNGFCVVVPSVAVWLAIFVGVQLLSSMAITEPYRWLTFVRNTSGYVSAALIVVIIANVVRSVRDIRRLISALIGAMASSSLLGLLAVTGVWQPGFKSPAGYLLPRWISETTYGGQIAFRAVGHPGWFLWIGEYYRLHGMFLFETSYGVALAIVLPLAIFRSAIVPRWDKKLLLLLVIMLLGFNLLFTTTRMPILSFFAGGAYLLFCVPNSWKRCARLMAIALVVGLAVWTLPMPPEAFDKLHDFVENVKHARGGGSFFQRTAVYRESLEQVARRPFLGYGTERDVEGLALPAGSHSYYIAVLYKHGIIGLSVLLLLGVMVWVKTRPPPPCADLEVEQRWLYEWLRYGRWVLVTTILVSFLEMPDLDGTLMAFLWIVLALLLRARALITDCSPVSNASP